MKLNDLNPGTLFWHKVFGIDQISMRIDDRHTYHNVLRIGAWQVDWMEPETEVEIIGPLIDYVDLSKIPGPVT